MGRLSIFVSAIGIFVPCLAFANPIAVGGMVHSVDGGHMADAQVELLPMMRKYERVRMILRGRSAGEPVAKTQTDASGRFLLEAPGAGTWTVVVRAPGFLPLQYSPLPLVSAVDLPPVTLLRNAGAQIEVVDPAGAAKTGVWVHAATGSKPIWAEVTRSGWRVAPRFGWSDASGQLILPRAEGERIQLIAVSSGSTVASRAEGKLTGTTRMVVTPDPFRWSIEVHDTLGRPLEGIVVATGTSEWPLGRTGPEGRLSFGGRGAKPFWLQLLSEDGRRQSVELRPTDSVPGPARFLFHPPTPRSGRIVAVVDRRPLAGVLVWPAHDSGSFAVTDSKGAYDLEALPGERFRIHALAPRFLPQGGWVPGRDGGANRAPTLALRAAAEVVGKVVDRAEKPLAGVLLEAVVLAMEAPLGFSRPEPLASRALSDAEGRFTLGNLHPERDYELIATRGGFAVAKVATNALGRSRTRNGLRLVLERARPAHGKVVDLEERPVPGAVVMLVPSSVPNSRRAKPLTAETDEAGRFKLVAIPASKMDIEAYKQGFAPTRVKGVLVPQGEKSIDLGTLILEPGAAIAGRVIDPEDEPIAEVGLWIMDDGGRTPPHLTDRLRTRVPQAVTESSGGYRLEDLQAGCSYDLLFRRSGYLPRRIVGVAAPSPKPVVAVLRPASRISGRVVDENDQPVDRARVSLYEPDPPPGTVGVGLRRDRGSRSAVTAGDGRFDLVDLAPGKAVLVARAAGFQPSPPIRVEIPDAGSLDDLTLVLEHGAVIEGRVSSSDGEPVMSARIRVGSSMARSDAEGFYRVEGVPDGPQDLAIKHVEFEDLAREIEVAPGVNTFDAVLEGGWQVSGQVLEVEGAPVEGAHVQVYSTRFGGIRRYHAVSDEEGFFSFPRVVDGTYDVEADGRGYALTRIERGLEVDGGAAEELEIRLHPAASVLGQISGLELDELSTVRVVAEGNERDRHQGMVDYEGSYEIQGMGPGVWQLKAQLRGGSRQVEARVVIEPGMRQVRRDLEFGDALTLSGTVSYDGRPLPQTSVSLRGIDVAMQRSVRTDYRGGFRIAELKSGRYWVGLANRREQLIYNQDIELFSDRELHIEIATARLSGTVISAATSRPVGDALVYTQQLLGHDGSQPGSLITVATNRRGRFTLGRLSAGRYRLTVREDGYAPAEHTLDIEAGAVLDDLQISLSPTEGLDLWVRRASGRPPELATLNVLDTSGSVVLTATRPLGEDGYARFASVPPGAWNLLISAPGVATTQVTAAVPGPPVELVLPEAARLEILVPTLVERNLIASVTLLGQDGRPFVGAGPAGALQQEWVLAGGAGVVDGVPAGVWTLTAVASDGQLWQRTVSVKSGLPVQVRLE